MSEPKEQSPHLQVGARKGRTRRHMFATVTWLVLVLPVPAAHGLHHRDHNTARSESMVITRFMTVIIASTQTNRCAVLFCRPQTDRIQVLPATLVRPSTYHTHTAS
ncbi:unnamed protein product [Ectocarpus sp. 6 AP-2014]